MAENSTIPSVRMAEIRSHRLAGNRRKVVLSIVAEKGRFKVSGEGDNLGAALAAAWEACREKLGNE